MRYLIQMHRGIVGFIIGFTLLAGIFWIIERLWPGIPGQKWRRRGIGTDLIYWVFTPVVTKWIVRAAILIVAVAIFGAMGFRPRNIPHNGFGPVAAQPVWLQVIEVIALGDLTGYWIHRAFHRGRLWPFHSIHHSPTEVDWMSSVRLHPVKLSMTSLPS